MSRSWAPLLVMALGACVEVSGGAVELSWEIREASGRESFDCDDPAIRLETVALEAVACEDGATTCSGMALRPEFIGGTWECDDKHGSTTFDIPPGTWALSIAATCSGQTEPTPNVRVPVPIVRQIGKGEVAQLGALLIVVDESAPPCDVIVTPDAAPAPDATPASPPDGGL